MSRTRAQSQAFKVAQIQQKRADRADERLAEVRREGGHLRVHAMNIEAQLQATAEHLIALHVQLATAQCDFEVERALRVAAQQGWQREASQRRQLEALPLWRVAGRRVRAWVGGLCQ